MQTNSTIKRKLQDYAQQVRTADIVLLFGFLEVFKRANNQDYAPRSQDSRFWFLIGFLEFVCRFCQRLSHKTCVNKYTTKASCFGYFPMSITRRASSKRMEQRGQPRLGWCPGTPRSNHVIFKTKKVFGPCAADPFTWGRGGHQTVNRDGHHSKDSCLHKEL